MQQVGKGHRTHLCGQLRFQVGVLQRKLDRAAAALAPAAKPAAVHRARVATRRLRVLLDAYRREFNPRIVKQYRRELKLVTRDLEAAREAEVMRQMVAQLAAVLDGTVSRYFHALQQRAMEQYRSAQSDLRLTIAGAAWRRRLAKIRELSGISSLVKEGGASAQKATQRLVKRHRRRLRDALDCGGPNAMRIHKIRLKVKTMRYLLEGSISKQLLAANLELTYLRRIQTCLGRMHDEEGLLEFVRAARGHRDAAHRTRRELKRRKKRYVHIFKVNRQNLLQLWKSAAVGATRRESAHAIS